MHRLKTSIMFVVNTLGVTGSIITIATSGVIVSFIHWFGGILSQWWDYATVVLMAGILVTMLRYVINLVKSIRLDLARIGDKFQTLAVTFDALVFLNTYRHSKAINKDTNVISQEHDVLRRYLEAKNPAMTAKDRDGIISYISKSHAI